jgi:inner membrane protein
MPWWGWIILGAMLLISETFFINADFYLVFVGSSALIVGVCQLLVAAIPVWAQWLGFAALAAATLVGFRRQLYRRWRGGAVGFPEGVGGDRAVALEAIAPGAIGRVELRGSVWSAHNQDSEAIEAKSFVRVERSDGTLLHVRRDAGWGTPASP